MELHGFADRLQGGEVDDGRDPVRSEHGIDRAGITNIAFDEGHPAPGDAGDALEHRAAAVLQVVEQFPRRIHTTLSGAPAIRLRSWKSASLVTMTRF